MEEKLLEFFKNLEEDYGISLERIMAYYSELQSIDIVRDGEEELARECLERIVQGLCSTNIIRNEEVAEIEPAVESYIISDALYNVYGEASAPYLDEEYQRINKPRQK